MNNLKLTVIVVVLVCLLPSIHAYTQTTGPGNVVKNYPVARQRLLAINTCQYIFTSMQGQIDQDSAMLFACRVHRLSRLLPYNEGYNTGMPSAGSQLIDSGYIEQAEALLAHVPAGQKLELLLDIANYYLYKPGAAKADMDKAFTYMQQANMQSMQTSLEAETYNLLGKYYFLTGNPTESDISFIKAEKLATAKNNKSLLALIWENKGKCQPMNSPARLQYLQQSMQLFHQLHSVEKEIEVLAEIITIHFRTDWALATKETEQQLALENSIGYKHTLYNHDAQAYLADMRGDFMQALYHANQAVQSMQATGDTTFATTFYTRIGGAYCHLGKNEQGIVWLQKAIAARKGLPQLFWYKSFLFLARQLIVDHSAQEALTLVSTVTASNPPGTAFDSIFYLQLQGLCYEHLNQPAQADYYYTRFTQMAEQFPPAYISAEFPSAYFQIAGFYLDQRNYPRSQQYIHKAISLSHGLNSLINKIDLEWLQFRLDSAMGNYASALQHHVAYTTLNDSFYNETQRKRMDELTVAHETEKKEQNITLLQQQSKLQQAQIKQADLARNITIAGIVLLLSVIGLLLNQYRIKKHTGHQAQEKNIALQRLLNEKEWLLKEIHHRVKNNLQTIVSLLESQSAYLQDDALLALQDSQNRVFAMSLIHQKLYQEENVASINMLSYLPELVSHLKDSFSFARHIHFHLQIAPVQMDVSQAIPLGLILNEAITNAIKYAFNDSSSHNEINISMQKMADQQVALLIADNGKGLPPGFNSLRTNSLGMKLMRGLTEDINGQFSISTSNGTLISVVFTPTALFYEADSNLVE